jgi:hypothetical protein
VRGAWTASAVLSVDVPLVGVAGDPALRAAGPIVTITNAAAQTSRYQCCPAAILSSPETQRDKIKSSSARRAESSRGRASSLPDAHGWE